MNGQEHQLSSGWRAAVELPDGPLDLIGDVHGELGALETLLGRLGYDAAGKHPQGRALVFLGDLVDRGPDSPGVVRRVAEMVSNGRAVCVLGNHDFDAINERTKIANTWLFSHGPVNPTEQVVKTQREREEILAFFRTLPLAAHRDDLRAVHACWDENALASLAAPGADPVRLYRAAEQAILARHAGAADTPQAKLALQNENPVKLITSGPERWHETARYLGGKKRHEVRIHWWKEYRGPMVVFGHYWRVEPMGRQSPDRPFDGVPMNAALGAGNAMCIDYSVGNRAAERRAGNTSGPFAGRLVALRWPERVLVFDDGAEHAMISPVAALGE